MNDLFDMSQFTEDFIEESTEIIESLDKELLKLEKDPGDKELLNSIFRSMHTLKGSAGFLNFGTIKDLAHKLENLLDKLRNGKLKVNSKIMDALLSGLDYLKSMVKKVIEEQNDEIDIEEISELVRKIDSEEIEGKLKETIKEEKEELKEELKEEVNKKIDLIEDVLDLKVDEDIEIKTDKKTNKSVSVHSIRVDTRRIDIIMNQVSELVTGRNRLLQIGSKFRSEELNETAAFIGRITTELQSSVMEMRMVPLEKVFSRFPRVVRDLSKDLNKEVELEIKGQETELDRIVIEEVYDPLVHMLRNALDHGIENPNEREKNGKERTGRIEIDARQEENFVYIDISDDGAGMDYKKIRAKAIEKSVVTEDEINSMSENDIINLIFKPGFSTVDKISEVSGRGVGMDVVKNSIEKLGGIVEISTEIGMGSVFRIRLPLTLAIMQVLLISIYENKYAIPLNSVIETIRIDKEDIKTISGGEVIFLRNKPLPLVYLSSVFDIKESEKKSDKLNIVVLGSGDKKAGLVIDDMLGKQEIVIKPLGRYLGKVQGISGTAILGDGSIIMILDSSLIVRNGKSLVKKKKVELKDQIKKNTRILYVEDSKSLQKMIKRSLEKKDFQVDVADNGADALIRTNDKEYDLILTDYEMPSMNGKEFIMNLRKQKGYKYTPVLVMTGKEIGAIKDILKNQSISAFIKKPFNEKELFDMLKKFS